MSENCCTGFKFAPYKLTLWQRFITWMNVKTQYRFYWIFERRYKKVSFPIIRNKTFPVITAADIVGTQPLVRTSHETVSKQ